MPTRYGLTRPTSALRTTTLVSFSGIDGAGKSTQIENLRSRLEQAGLRVHLVTFWDDVAVLRSLREEVGHKVFKGEKGVGSPDAPIHRRDKNVRSPFMTVARLGMYLLDALSLRRVAAKNRRAGADVIIFDRYIYDELANLDLSNPFARLYARGVMTLVPRPDFGFVLDANPPEAHARKPEYPLDFLYLNREAYLNLSELLGGITVIPPMAIADAKSAVAGHVLGASGTLLVRQLN